MTGTPAVRTVGVMTTTTMPTVDEQATEAFAGRLVELFTGGALTYLVDIGRRCRLFEVAATTGPVTSGELAARAGLQERYVREWLGAMVTGGIFEFEPADGRYWLPGEHAVCLTGDGVENLAPLAFVTTVLGEHVPAVARAFRDGGGVPFEAYLPDLHDAMDALFGPVYDHLLVDAIVPLVPGLHDRLTAGGALRRRRLRHRSGRDQPRRRLSGLDVRRLRPRSHRARTRPRPRRAARPRQRLVPRVRCRHAACRRAVRRHLHLQRRPRPGGARSRARARPRRARAGGVLVLDEPGLSNRLEDNVDHPLAPFTYAVSTLHCLTVSLAGDGAGLGTVWGHQTAVDMLTAAGFVDVAVHDAPGDPGNAVFVATRQR